MKITTPTVIVKRKGKPDSLLVQKSRIIVIDGAQQGDEIVLESERFTMGSSPQNDMVIVDPAVSKQHCEIQLFPQGYLIRDLESTNGTFVHGVRVTDAFLNDGSEITLGTTRLLFCPLQATTEFTLSDNDMFGRVIGKSIAMKKLFYIAETYAPTDTTILIEGATGTGKEILAEEIHNHSKRRDGPFVVIDCGALSHGIVESELFGHTRGAYTGAATDRMGAFEQANGGTIFIDEISELDLMLQPKLLRVLEKKEVRRMGSNKMKHVDVRIICATNLSLEKQVNSSRFREDLYFRISIAKIVLPPLRNRKEDISLLTQHFLKEFTGEEDAGKLINLQKTMQAFNEYDWPGNVRELRNLVEMTAHAPEGMIDPGAHMYLGRMGNAPSSTAAHQYDESPFKEAKNRVIGDFEEHYLRELLDRNEWNVSKAAREADIERVYLIRLMKKYGMKRTDTI
ncbi:MAG: FHA domain-containing protein [Lentisphaerales bacterium]|nr:MAG: FHA domain-containing protein [Lentisphaerales bacterium]